MPTEIFLDRAQRIADAVIERLKPYCKRIEVAGSVRRGRPRVHDIDLVIIPNDPWRLYGELPKLGQVKMSGSKISRLMVGEIQVDLYFATDETWATLLLIRTGSTQNNIRLCALAKKKGWHLAADGSGLFNEKGERIAGDTEVSIYDALGLPYQEPRGRG
uniref:Putative DNA polymerase n=1 Tax=viral metagenome TaxID=1070528 RepID=A0A6M3IRC0_9ZZZZ